MTCEHLIELEKALLANGATVTHRGAAWTRNCREWVYFDVYLDIDAIRGRFALSGFVETHENPDPRSGTERGLVCRKCNDAIMGLHERGDRVFPGLAPPEDPPKGFDLDALRGL